MDADVCEKLKASKFGYFMNNFEIQISQLIQCALAKVTSQYGYQLVVQLKSKLAREAFKNVLADFVPPTPLTDNHFAKKPLADRGGTPPPLTDNPQKKGSKRAKVFVFWPEIAVFQQIFSLTKLGGTPPSPLTDNHCAQKSLAERGGTPPL